MNELGSLALESTTVLSLVLAVAAISEAAVSADASPPRLLNRGELITSNDYPAIAIDEQQQGTATVRLRVNRYGYVQSCKIVRSSGSQALDEQTCAVYRARARFEPGRDGQGRPQPSDYTQRVTWKLEGDPPILMPRQPWMTRSTVTIGAQGAFLDCKTEAVGLAKPPNDCETLEALVKQVGSTPDKFEPITGSSITEAYFYPVPLGKAATPPRLRDANQLAQQVSEITVDPTGRVTGCKGVRYLGIAGPEFDACPMLQTMRFTPVAGEASLIATVVMTIYTRTNSGA